MKTIRIDHPKENIRNALIYTLKQVMPEMEFQAVPTADSTNNVIFSPQSPPQRLKAIVQQLRLDVRRAERPKSFPCADATIHLQERVFAHQDNTIPLTEKEADLLLYLWRRETPATREDLLKDVWEYAQGTDTHTIETHIYRLRRKIEPNPEEPIFLLTTKDGYQLAASASSSA